MRTSLGMTPASLEVVTAFFEKFEAETEVEAQESAPEETDAAAADDAGDSPEAAAPAPAANRPSLDSPIFSDPD